MTEDKIPTETAAEGEEEGKKIFSSPLAAYG